MFLKATIFLACTIAQASQPTTTELSDALTAAETAWGVSATVEFREPLNACVLRDNPIVATTQDMDTVTTVRFDDSEPVESHQVTHVIRINSNCDWGNLNIKQVVLHEIGHLVVGPHHSADKKSIMFWLVRGDQKIMPEDRAMVRAGL